MATANTKPKAATAAPKKVNIKEFWLKDNTKNHRWTVLHVPNCTYYEDAVNLLKERGEKFIQVTTYSEGNAQQAIAQGHNYSPAIFLDGKLIGSISELESYFRRNYFSTIQEAMQE